MKYIIPFSIVTLFFIACGSEEEAPDRSQNSERPIPVRTALVEEQSIELSIQASGAVTSESQAKPAFKTGGVIARMYAEQGDFVSKGQLLASLDLTEINAQVQQANEAVDKAKRDLERAQNLYADSVATLENVQDATTGLTVAEQNLRMADFNRNFSEIRSPIAGKVIQKLVNQGEIVGPGMPAYFILGNTARDWVIKSGLADRDWARVKLGDRAEVRFDAYPGEIFEARITQVAETANPGSGTFDVELSLVQPPGRLAAGLIASVEIFPKITDHQMVVPLDALLEADGSQAKVFSIKEGKAQVHQVRVAFLHQDWAVISSGLDGVKNVVTDGGAYLFAGAKVNEVE